MIHLQAVPGTAKLASDQSRSILKMNFDGLIIEGFKEPRCVFVEFRADKDALHARRAPPLNRAEQAHAARTLR